jgi:predicted outer membrane repeat protein
MVTNLSGSAVVSGSLPFEVAHAAPGDIIQFATNLKGGTIFLGNTLDIAKNLTIDGAGNGISVNGGGNQVFEIEGIVAEINALMISGGHASFGGGIRNEGSLSLSNSTLTGNSAVSGGAIYSEGTLTMSGDTVNNNTATADGGGVWVDHTATIINCTLTNNVANRGGGILNYSPSVLMMDNCTVAYNTVTGLTHEGGGILTLSHGSQLKLLNTIVFNPNSGAATQNDVFGPTAQAQGDLFGSLTTVIGGGEPGGQLVPCGPPAGTAAAQRRSHRDHDPTPR